MERLLAAQSMNPMPEPPQWQEVGQLLHCRPPVVPCGLFKAQKGWGAGAGAEQGHQQQQAMSVTAPVIFPLVLRF
jgi:hypothetical protein